MEVQAAQIVAPLLLLFGTFFLGVLPIWLVKRLSSIQRGAQGLSFLVCIGGGVLFATSFLHLLPEVREGFENLDTEFPVTEGVVCLGFLAVYALEELIHACLGHSHSSTSHGHAHSPAVMECHDHREQLHQDGAHDNLNNGQVRPYGTDTSPTSVAADEPLHDVTIAGILIVAALSFHSLFEGLSLGLQDSERATWIMFLAISFHKYVLAFVVGFDLSASRVRPRNVVIQMLVFSMMSPLGSIVGAITRNNLEDTIVVVVLNGIASGTLIYITFFEVLQRQKNDKLPGLWRLLAVIVGFTLMLTLILVLPHD
uniref:Putative fe2+/zn2+ regulated transporter n=1 Tax=Ixodes ricinus TaxID=34613 RepID=V5HQX3_IXORI